MRKKYIPPFDPYTPVPVPVPALWYLCLKPATTLYRYGIGIVFSYNPYSYMRIRMRDVFFLKKKLPPVPVTRMVPLAKFNASCVWYSLLVWIVLKREFFSKILFIFSKHLLLIFFLWIRLGLFSKKKKHLASGSAHIGTGTEYTKTRYRYRINTDSIYV
jgi:hypothetical protein